MAVGAGDRRPGDAREEAGRRGRAARAGGVLSAGREAGTAPVVG